MSTNGLAVHDAGEPYTMKFVPYNQLTPQDIYAIEVSLNQAPIFERESIEDVLTEIRDQDIHTFYVPGGIVGLSRLDNDDQSRLSIRFFTCDNFGARIRGIITGLRVIATAWECDKIETRVYNPGLMQMIMKLGGTAESVNLTLEVRDG